MGRIRIYILIIIKTNDKFRLSKVILSELLNELKNLNQKPEKSKLSFVIQREKLKKLKPSPSKTQSKKKNSNNKLTDFKLISKLLILEPNLPKDLLINLNPPLILYSNPSWRKKWTIEIFQKNLTKLWTIWWLCNENFTIKTYNFLSNQIS